VSDLVKKLGGDTGLRAELDRLAVDELPAPDTDVSSRRGSLVTLGCAHASGEATSVRR